MKTKQITITYEIDAVDPQAVDQVLKLALHTAVDHAFRRSTAADNHTAIANLPAWTNLDEPDLEWFHSPPEHRLQITFDLPVFVGVKSAVLVLTPLVVNLRLAIDGTEVTL